MSDELAPQPRTVTLPADRGPRSRRSGEPAKRSPKQPEAERATSLGVLRCVLVVSATMGEGHNATGQALTEAVGRLWPAARVEWLDTLDVMGPGIGPLFRSIYSSNVEHAPWLYELFYDSLCHRPWFAHGSKRFVGAWAGRRMYPLIRARRPDVILSTYPLGTAALAWLRRHRGLRTPVGAWVSDFAPHPFWVYTEVDLNLVMHEIARPLAERQVPGAPVDVTAPTVRAAFAPQDQAVAREAAGLPPHEFVALLSCGSLAFGDEGAAARALLEAAPEVQVIAVCGRNDHLRSALASEFAGEDRIRVLGWVDDMPTLQNACDVLVTNGGGATALEALACGRAVLMYRPIAGHGLANAELMERAGLAVVCRDQAQLTAAIRRFHAEPQTLAEMQQNALQQAHRRSVEDGLTRLLEVAHQGAVTVPGGA